MTAGSGSPTAAAGDPAAGSVPVGAGGSWTPLPDTARTVVPGPNGGYLPGPAGRYPASAPASPPPAVRPGSVRYPGGSTGGGPGGAGEPLAPRSGGPGQQTTSGRTGVAGEAAGGAARGPAGSGGGLPMGLGGGLGGRNRDHRNQYYIPEDEPFQVEFTDVAPSVLGMPGEGAER